MKTISNFDVDAYGDNVIQTDVTFEKGLPLGNNFTESHMIEAIKNSDEYEDLVELLGNSKPEELFILKAQGRYGMIESDTYVCDELYDLLVSAV